MHKLYEALLDQLRELHAGMLKTLDEMPAESLDWTPGPQMNSLSVLIVHLTGAERYWIGDVVKGEPSFRDRNAEFLVKGLDAAALKKRITDLDAYEAAAFEPLGVAQLEQGRVSPRDGKLVTVAWALMHAVQHSAVHAGHIEILSQQWKQRKAP
jgi:uncharacterized damage-inducible protein DinB